MVSLFAIVLIIIFRIGYHNIYSFHENIQFWQTTSDYKTKVRSKHQKTVAWTRLDCNIKVVKPTFVNWLFLVTLVISGTVPSHSNECSVWEHKVLGRRAFGIIFYITLLNFLYQYVLIFKLKCVIDFFHLQIKPHIYC